MASPLMEWMMITADPGIASHAESSGVHKIFIDMETLGKVERQGHVDTHKASHSYADISAVRNVLTSAELLVRINPVYEGTPEEVERSIINGADRLMLPMFATVEEVRWFRELVPASIPITFLAETPAAVARVEAWAPELGPNDEVHFGLNDLGLAMGLGFLFETLAGGFLDSAASKLRSAEIPFGIGGVARIGVGELPAEWILGEHVRLGSSRAILSRAFQGSATSLEELKSTINLEQEITRLEYEVEDWQFSTAGSLESNRERVANASFKIASSKRVHA